MSVACACPQRAALGNPVGTRCASAVVTHTGSRSVGDPSTALLHRLRAEAHDV